MSLNSAMFAGVSGLMAYGNAMNVTGDNIANVNTIGFKPSRSIFADILASSVAQGSSTLQFGRGAAINGVMASFEQGSFETTGNATDMAIQGSGFFIVSDEQNNAPYYTRAGQFIIDNSGRLSNPSGLIVQGYQLSTDAAGDIVRSNTLANIDITGAQSAPKATTAFTLGMNLNAAASAGTTFSTSFNAYNSLGETVTVTYTFTKTAVAQTWDYAATGPAGTTLTGAGQAGTLTFSPTGALLTPVADQSLIISGFASGAADLTMNWNMYDEAAAAPLSDITGYASASASTSTVQDGFDTGVLRGISVDSDGIISGLFSNGKSQELWQIGMADFLSPWGLSRQGDSLFTETGQSGQPVLGVANLGGMGSVYGSSLELSAVDLSREFVSMIQNQRAYQANSRIITTVDQMLQEAVSLKR